MKKTIAVFLVVISIIVMLAGCSTQAQKVSFNISKEADQFNVQRRVTIINARTDKIVLEVIGNLSVLQSSGDVDIIVEIAPGEYKKHFVRLNQWTLYAVEDISGANVDKYHYEINYQPETIGPFGLLPVTITNDD